MSEERPEGWIEPTMEEPEGDDDDEESQAGELEPAPAEPPAGQITEAQAEAILKSLEREAARHAREVEKRAGPMWSDLTPCPCCTGGAGTVGFIVAELPEPLQSMRREQVSQALGGSQNALYEIDQEREQCPTCKGRGMLRTGSLVPQQDALPCRTCNGQGWRQKLAPVTAPAVTFPQVATAGGSTVAGPQDPWGRPLGHPHFNIAPAEVGA